MINMNITYCIIAIIVILILTFFEKFIIGTLINFAFLIIFIAGIYFLGKKLIQLIFK